MTLAALDPFEETYALVLQLCALHGHAAEAVGVLEDLPVDKQPVPWAALCTALFAVDAEGERGYALLEDGEARGLEAPPALQEEALCFLCARSWREEVARRWGLLAVSGADPVCHGASCARAAGCLAVCCTYPGTSLMNCRSGMSRCSGTFA